MKRYVVPALWAMGMLVLILDGQTAVSGASEGLTLCIRTLIPSLFPFFVLSAMLTDSLSGGGLLLAGILGGYPVGAANAARAYRAGKLDKEEARRMVVLCNCAGPSFLFGVLGPVLGSVRDSALLWGVYLLGVLSLWMLFPKSAAREMPRCPIRLQQAVWASIRAMAGVCGWVILFRVVLAVLDRWVLWLLPDWGRVLIFGILELSNGCLALARLEPGLRFVMAAGMLGFGGLCVMLQTASVTEGISLGLHFPGKIFQGTVCMLLASLLRPGVLPVPVQAALLAMSVCLGFFLRKSEKRCRNPASVIV